MAAPNPTTTRFTRFVIVLALVGGLVNLGIELAVPPESRSVRTHSSGTLGGLLSDEHDFVKQRYQLYGQLRDVAPGGAIVIPSDLLDTRTLQYLSGLEVERSGGLRRVDESALERLPDAIRYRDVTEPTVGSGELYPYVVAVTDDAPAALLTFVTRVSNTILIVDRATAAAMQLP